jgi:7-cyano-7-deazaguanine reductase
MKKYSLTQLGGDTKVPLTPETAILETVANPHPNTNYVVRFTCPEFTSLCPVTGQPDFAHLVIDYIPNKKLVESKSLKLYFFSFRNHAAFHESCTVDIGKRLVKELNPKWLRIGGYWFPRGGMPIDVFYQHGKLPPGSLIPEQGVPPYRGR